MYIKLSFFFFLFLYQYLTTNYSNINQEEYKGKNAKIDR